MWGVSWSLVGLGSIAMFSVSAYRVPSVFLAFAPACISKSCHVSAYLELMTLLCVLRNGGNGRSVLYSHSLQEDRDYRTEWKTKKKGSKVWL